MKDKEEVEKMKRNTAIVIASILLPMCFVALSEQRGGGKLPLSYPSDTGTNAEKKIVSVLDRIAKSHETYLSVPVRVYQYGA